MKRPDLFRQEAVQHQASRLYGSVSINVPVSYTVVIYGLGLILIGFLVFSMITDYTEHDVVKGYVNVKSGLVRVYPLRSGIVRQQYVVAGQHVRQGERLYTIDRTYDDLAGHDSREYRQLQTRMTGIVHDIERKTHYLQQLKPLLRQHYIALNVYQQVRDERRALEVNRHDLEMAFIRYQRSRSDVIRAPIAGDITSVEYTVGQGVNPTKALLTLIPAHAERVAQLYIPVAKSGFIHRNDPITLRYDAYPYQHFGVATGHIMSVTHSILSDQDEDKPLTIGEPYYRAIAQLDQQNVSLNGRSHRLQQGMTFTAVLSGASKTIWHWIFDPIVH